MLNLLSKWGKPAMIGPYLAAFSCKSHRGTAIILTFLGTAKVSTRMLVLIYKNSGLRLGGNLTRKSMVLSFGLVTCAGIYGYYRVKNINDIILAYHWVIEIGSIPCTKTLRINIPLGVRSSWRQLFTQSPRQSRIFILTRSQSITGTTGTGY